MGAFDKDELLTEHLALAGARCMPPMTPLVSPLRRINHAHPSHVSSNDADTPAEQPGVLQNPQDRVDHSG